MNKSEINSIPRKARFGIPHLFKPSRVRTERISSSFSDRLDDQMRELSQEICHTRSDLSLAPLAE